MRNAHPVGRGLSRGHVGDPKLQSLKRKDATILAYPHTHTAYAHAHTHAGVIWHTRGGKVYYVNVGRVGRLVFETKTLKQVLSVHPDFSEWLGKDAERAKEVGRKEVRDRKSVV